jgi:hypothetical protein
LGFISSLPQLAWKKSYVVVVAAAWTSWGSTSFETRDRFIPGCIFQSCPPIAHYKNIFIHQSIISTGQEILKIKKSCMDFMGLDKMITHQGKWPTETKVRIFKRFYKSNGQTPDSPLRWPP